MTDVAPGYAHVADLSPGTHLCRDAAGRLWVLKRLPDDCRHGRDVHPAIADRLIHVRDLPHPRIATLAGVVRGTDPAAAYAVWQHVDGHPIGPDPDPDLAGQLTAAVQLLHARGLVHGGLTASNVIVTPVGDVWLTHVSPYLWDDPAVDAQAVADLVHSPPTRRPARRPWRAGPVTAAVVLAVAAIVAAVVAAHHLAAPDRPVDAVLPLVKAG